MAWIPRILLSFAILTAAQAAEPPLLDSQYQVDEWIPAAGFPEETVLGIYREANDYLWLGTAHGLIRFDGQDIQTTFPPGLATEIWSVARNFRHDLLCTVIGRGIFRLDGRRLTPVLERNLSAARPAALYSARSGHALLLDGREMLLEDDAGEYHLWQTLPEPGLAAVELEHEVWAVASGTRLLIVRGSGQPVATYALSADFRAISRDGRGGVYVGTSTGLDHFASSTGAGGWPNLHRSSIAHTRPVRALALEESGLLWVGTQDGIYRLEGNHLARFRMPTRDPEAGIKALAYDPEGNLWGAYIHGGMFRVRKPLFPNWSTREGISGVRSALHDGAGGVWLATAESLLHIADDGRIRRAAGSWQDFTPRHLVLEDPGTLLIGSFTGVRRLNTRTLDWSPVVLPPSGTPWRLLFRTHQGVLWIGNEAGELYTRDGAHWRREPLTGVPVLNETAMMAESQDGRLWLSAMGAGLFLLEGGRAVPVAANQPESLRVYALYADAENTLWAGLHTGGIARLNGDRLESLSLEANPQRDDVYFIAEDTGGYLWLGMRAGLIRVRKTDLSSRLAGRRASLPLRRYTVDGGIPSGNFGIASDHSHREPASVLWLPHLNGVMRVEPRRLLTVAPPPVVQINAVIADGVPVALESGSAEIPPHCERLLVTYSAPYFRDSAQVRYAYQLTGFQTEPVGPVPDRQAVFTRPPPGQFTLEIRARNGDGAWSAAPARLALNVQPAFYQTWPFRIALAIAAVAAIAALGDWRLRHLRRDKARLEERVLERTHQLDQEREKAEMAAKAKTDFLAVMSHEIRTPLHGVLGTLELLGGCRLEGEEREYVATARRSGEALLELLNDVLDLSRLEAGQMTLRPHEFALDDLLEGLVETFRHAAELKGLDLRLRSPAPLPHVVGDRARLRQILSNLIGNAVKFTDHGAIEVNVTAEAAAAGATRLRIAIRDTGIGISPERIGGLFRPFAQVDTSSTRRHSGTGLGLAISRRLAQEMGGSLEVKSEPGRGSEFLLEVSLPLGEPPAPAPALPALEHGRPLRGRILLVEDNKVNQMVASRLLRQLGCSVDIAVDGLDGVEQARAAKYDVILMDCQMPRVSGLEATVRIRRERGLNSQIPVIALTANSAAEDREACLASGMNGFLSKPFNAVQLRDAIAPYLDAGAGV